MLLTEAIHIHKNSKLQLSDSLVDLYLSKMYIHWKLQSWCLYMKQDLLTAMKCILQMHIHLWNDMTGTIHLTMLHIR